MVGAIGFEPTTPCAQGRCATRLRYAPTFTAFRGCSAPSRILLQGSEMEQGLRGVVAHVFAYGPARFTARAKAHGRHYLAFGRFYAASA
jgi:hypothetical protein